MKAAIEFTKIALLLVIVVLLSRSIGLVEKPVANKIESTEPPASIALATESKVDGNPRASDLREILEQSLAQIFRFPGSVEFRDTRYEYNRGFHDRGINIPPERELEFATLCGRYSAPSAMGIYGAFSPFYAEVAVDNLEKGITGSVWLDIDGKIKKLTSLDSPRTLDGDRDQFVKLYAKNCGDISSSFMGAFNQYAIGDAAVYVKRYLEKLEKLDSYPDAKASLNDCLNSGVSIDYCIGTEFCQRVNDLDEDVSKFCATKDQVCSADDKPVDCELKVKAEYKAKKSSME